MKPNIVFIMADNLGWGELGCYGGGALRGAPTPNIDRLAAQGLLLHNYNVESDCVPTRSALMSGRYPIRTGCLQHAPAGLPQGLPRKERTLAEILSEAGYATAHFGKWHLGDVPGRFPSDRGFDEWYGIPRTTDESMFTSTPGYDPTVTDLPYIMEGRVGKESKNVKIYDLDSRRLIDEELQLRSIDFMRNNVAEKKPFFLYFPMVHLHVPTIPHPDFAGRSGVSNFADSMLEMDFRVGKMVEAVDELGIAENTMFVFCSDNGPEFRSPYRGTAGPWRGTYHTAMEGALRVPFIARWPGKIEAGQTSNEMIHVTDIFTTLVKIAGATLPDDRPIDGIDQSDFFFSANGKSARESLLFYIKNDLRAVKWRNWKLHFFWEPEVNDSRPKLEQPYLFNLMSDPKEEMNVWTENTWVMTPLLKAVHAFNKTVAQYPNTPPGEMDESPAASSDISR
jgi:arylsulfatase A-like enzyme